MKPTKKTDLKKPWSRKPEKKPFRVEEKPRDKLFLIICEGKNTESCYFQSFPVSKAYVESYGLGSSKTALVKSVLEVLKNDEDAKRKEIWVVFDLDIKSDQSGQLREDYNRAIEIARSKKLKVAYSNDAFELWFLLHYQYFDSQITRHEYYEKLNELWGCNYEKVGKQLEFCMKIYPLLEEDTRASQSSAISNASKLLQDQTHLIFSEQNPCTTVFELIEELNKYL